jgi:hypothetical protein
MAKFAVNVEGAKYEVEAPDENTAWQWAYTTHMQGQRPAPKPAAPKIPERTYGEAFTDTGAELLGGVSDLVQLPGQLYGLATGDFSKTGALGAGQELEEYAKGMKSASLLAREKARAEKVAQAEKQGQLAAFKTAFGETVSDPALLTSFLARQLPQLIPAAITGGGTAALTSGSVLAKELAKGTAKEAAEAAAKKAAIKSGTTAAVQTGAVQQGADIGAGSYDEIYAELSKRMPAERAAAETINLARAAGVSGYALSVLANRFLPGGGALERVLAGEKTGKGIIRGGVAGALKELPSENVEEVGGRLAQNIAARAAGLDRDLTSGLGETAAMASLGAAGMGGITGIVGGRQTDQQIRDEVLRQEALKQREEEQQKQEAVVEEPATTEVKKEGKPSIVGTEFEEVAPGTIVEKPPVDIAEVQRDPKIAAMQAEYDKRDAEIKELESRGLTLNAGEKYKLTNKRKTNAELKAKIDDALSKVAPQGAANVAGTISEAAGESTTLSAQPAVNVSTTTGLGEAKRDGMVSTGPDVTGTAEGKGTEPVAVEPTLEQDIATQKKLRKAIDKAEKQLLKDENLASGDPRIDASRAAVEKAQKEYDAFVAESEPRRTKRIEELTKGNKPTGPSEEVKKEMEEKVKQVADLYDEEREYAKLDDDGANLYDALQTGKLPAGMELGTARLDAVLERNELELPDLPDDFEFRTAQSQLEIINEALNDLKQQIDDKRAVLVDWKTLTDDQRQVYLDNIRNNTAQEHANARRALVKYRKQLREAQGKPKDLKADPSAGVYERNRQAYKSRDRLEYPTWEQLNDEQRALYNKTLSDKQREKGKEGKKGATAEDHDVAFKAVADKLVEEGYIPAPGKTYLDVREAQLKKSEAESQERAQREIKEEREGKKAKPTGEKKVPNALIDKIKEGDLGAVLNWLSTSIPNPNKTIAIKLQRLVASRIKSLGLKTKIKYVDSLPDGDIAQYDPESDTILVTPEGATATTLLHELVHAATIKILDRVANNDTKGLTPEQIDAANQLDDIMALTARDLAESFPNAYKNIFEFVSEVISNPEFQAALKKYPATGLEYTLTPDRSVLSRFIESVVELLNLKNLFTRSGAFNKPNLLSEAFTAFESIIEVPEGGIERAPLPAPKAAPTTQPAPAKVDVTTEEAIKRNELPETSGINALRKLFTTRQGGMNLVTKFQNARYAIKSWEDGLTRAGKIIFSGDKLNNIYTQIALAASRAKDLYLTRVNTPASDMQSAIGAYAKASGLTTKEATERLHVYLMGLHEGERRDVKYMLNVPLSNDKILKIGNEILSPAGFRERIMDEVLSGTLTKDQIKTARDALNKIVLTKDANGKLKYVDPTGSSPNGYKSVDRNNEEYNVIGGYTPKSIQNFIDSYENDPNKKEVDKVIAAMRKLQDATKELNKEANYWSAPVQSIVDFYGWKNYVPFAGKEKYTNEADAMLDFNSNRLGREMQEGQNSFEGRETDSDNSIVQSLTDATRAAMRAGRRDVTLAIKNAVAKDKDGNQLLKGRIAKTIPFADRYKDLNIGEEKKENVIFHYNKDGSIDVIEIYDKAQRNAIRRTYEQSQPIIDMLNHVTSTVGQMHTRYNIAFAPVNFFRDALTNAYSIGVEMGPKASAQYIGAIATNVANGGLFRAAKVAALYEAGKFDQIKAMAKKSDYVRDMLEYIEQGGKVSYLAGLSSKGQFKELQKSLDRTGILKTKDQIDKFVDIYTDMFELASRTAAYRIAKSQARAEGLSEADAQVKAAGYAKGLANFEQVGEWGRAAGAAFMFFRPAATGAVRAIESLAPMLRDPKDALKELPEYIQKDKVASAEFLKKYNDQKKAATAMTLGLLGMGSAIYLMSMALSDDDDLGRNRTATDDANRWSRYARFHIPGMDTPIQIPWGFGLGAFASAGGQIAALATGNSSVKTALSNIVVTGLDSFLPLPVSRISPIDNFPAWAMDSATPSVARPFLEWVMNIDGLGREIYNNRQSRYGDAYTGGDNIPELYKSAARTLAEITDGKVDWSPNTMYFFANNYGDGLMRLAQTGYNYGLLAAGEKAFNPKTDTVFFDSFFGAPSNFDARQFSEVEKQILAKQQKLNMFKDSNPEAYARYVEKNPMDEYIVEHYNKVINQDLKKLREEANIYRRMPGLTPKERTEAVKNVVKFQNLIKRGIIEDFEMMGVEP